MKDTLNLGPRMIWLIALLCMGLIAVIIYRVYLHPPLPQSACEQKTRYRLALQYEKVLLYHMNPSAIRQFYELLACQFHNLGNGCYSGRGIFFKVMAEETYVSIYLYGANEQAILPQVWKVIQIQRQATTNSQVAPTSPFSKNSKYRR
ncbi:MAG: hypothetical protein ACTSRS_13100 [Candidatus Helarchaeota archaeon]